jgi:hypothetical protein
MSRGSGESQCLRTDVCADVEDDVISLDGLFESSLCPRLGKRAEGRLKNKRLRLDLNRTDGPSK